MVQRLQDLNLSDRCDRKTFLLVVHSYFLECDYSSVRVASRHVNLWKGSVVSAQATDLWKFETRHRDKTHLAISTLPDLFKLLKVFYRPCRLNRHISYLVVTRSPRAGFTGYTLDNIRSINITRC